MGEPAWERSSVATWRSISSSESEEERERCNPLGGWPKVVCGVVAWADTGGVGVRRRGEEKQYGEKGN